MNSSSDSINFEDRALLQNHIEDRRILCHRLETDKEFRKEYITRQSLKYNPENKNKTVKLEKIKEINNNEIKLENPDKSEIIKLIKTESNTSSKKEVHVTADKYAIILDLLNKPKKNNSNTDEEKEFIQFKSGEIDFTSIANILNENNKDKENLKISIDEISKKSYKENENENENENEENENEETENEENETET